MKNNWGKGEKHGYTYTELIEHKWNLWGKQITEPTETHKVSETYERWASQTTGEQSCLFPKLFSCSYQDQKGKMNWLDLKMLLTPLSTDIVSSSRRHYKVQRFIYSVFQNL